MPAFDKIFETAAAGMATADADGRLLQVNPAFCQLLDYPPDELLRLSIFDITHPQDLPRTRQLFDDATSGRHSEYNYHKRYLRKDGSVAWGLTSVIWLEDGEGRPSSCVALVQDISRQKQADQTLQEREEVYRTLVENIGLGISLVDENHRIVMVNSTRARMLGRPANSLAGRNCFHEFQQGKTICTHCPGVRAMRTGRSETRIVEETGADGEKMVVRLQAFPVFNAQGRADRFIEVCEDITGRVNIEQQLRESRERLEFYANYDPVTQLPNRFLLFDRLTRFAARCSQTSNRGLLLVVGLNRFKKVNETFGRQSGDQVLLEVGRRLRDCVRATDTVAFIGSGEFALAVEEVGDLRVAVALAEKILQSLQRPFSVDGHDLHLAASIGLSRFPDDGGTPETLLKAAEVALAKARTDAPEGYCFYTADLDARARELVLLESGMAKALEAGEFLLHYQPQVDLDTGRLSGVEALIRWQRPDQRLMAPGSFIPLAESTGLIVPIGIWGLRAACQQAVAWGRQGVAPLRMAVNISPRQFHQPGLAATVEAVLQETGLHPSLLELEITETAIMKDIDAAVRTMHQIDALGVCLAIDDFGTGYSSLGYLKRFPLRKLKVDQSFVRDVSVDGNSAAITASVIALGRAMNLEVVAEGIETVDQLAFLRRQGCHQGQGYLFSRPVPASELHPLLRQGTFAALFTQEGRRQGRS